MIGELIMKEGSHSENATEFLTRLAIRNIVIRGRRIGARRFFPSATFRSTFVNILHAFVHLLGNFELSCANQRGHYAIQDHSVNDLACFDKIMVRLADTIGITLKPAEKYACHS